MTLSLSVSFSLSVAFVFSVSASFAFSSFSYFSVASCEAMQIFVTELISMSLRVTQTIVAKHAMGQLRQSCVRQNPYVWVKHLCFCFCSTVIQSSADSFSKYFVCARPIQGPWRAPTLPMPTYPSSRL